MIVNNWKHINPSPDTVNTLTRIRLAVALALPFAVSPAGQAQQTPPVPSMPVSEVWTVVRAAAHELNAADDPLLPVPERLERAAHFGYSDQTAAGLTRIFGSAHPYTIERVPGAGAGSAYRIGVPALRHTDDKGLLTEWEALRAEVQVDRTGRGVETHAVWPSVVSGNDELRFGMRGLRYDSKVRFGYRGLWFGSVGIHADSIEAGSDKHGFKVRSEDVNVDGHVVEKPKTIDQIGALNIKAIRFGDQSIDDFRLAMRFLNFDKAASAELARESSRMQSAATDTPPAQQLEALKPMLRALGKSVLAKGAVVHIDELGMGYGGQRASLKGQLRVANGTLADLDDPQRILKKLVARVEIRVPVALVREAAGAFAAKQAAAQAAQHGGQVDAATVAQLRQGMTDVVVGKLVGGGFARIENEVLISTVEWRNGTLLANGKPVPLPAPQPQPGGQAPLAAAPGRGNYLQPRKVDGSCAMPAYPDDSVLAGRTLRLGVDYLIGTDGHVRQPAVRRPSGFPDYDRAVLAALAQCTWIPALRDGQPVEVPMSEEFVRTAGAEPK